MDKLRRKWTICFIMHSHTDIGYTDRQDRIEDSQVDFIKQAIEINEAAILEKKPQWKGFKWTCETFWPVEKFIEKTDRKWHDRLLKAVKSGGIDITGNYLNFSELISYDVLKNVTSRAGEFCRKNKIRLDSAMTADVNGYAWGYSQALVDAGIRNFFTCIHTHHGMYPLRKKQVPFLWKAPGGEKLLVWSGEHYHYGNVLGIVPDALIGRYIVRDNLNESTDIDSLRKQRIFGYVRGLEDENYPYQFVPIMGSGLPTDNSAPNPDVVSFIEKWNIENGSQVRIEMMTLHEFFAMVRKNVDAGKLPVYSGDWPDWWADWTGSLPNHTMAFREGQRVYDTVRKLNRDNPDFFKKNADDIIELETAIAVYAEHTYGHSDSCSRPWQKTTSLMRMNTEAFAMKVHQLAYRLYDMTLRERGEIYLSRERKFKWKTVNPEKYPVTAPVKFYIDFWEEHKLLNGFELIDEKSGKVVSSQYQRTSRGREIISIAELKAGEERVFAARPSDKIIPSAVPSRETWGSETVDDIVDDSVKSAEFGVFGNSIETPFHTIRWEIGKGIVSWFDKTLKIELLKSERRYNAFTPVYELTPAEKDSEKMVAVRKYMGRNRRGADAVVSTGKLVSCIPLQTGDITTGAELVYEADGTSLFKIVIRAYRKIPQIDVSVQFDKQNVWAPENMYIAFPFEISQDNQLWLEKTGCIIRPDKDQLPGTNRDYYLIQEGLVLTTKNYGIALGVPDIPLVYLGHPEFKSVELYDPQKHKNSSRDVYIWLMNNFWETNAGTGLGGFYEFEFHLHSGKNLSDEKTAVECCRRMNMDIPAFRVK